MCFAKPVEVKVGAYRIPPFFEHTANGQKGITVELIKYLNKNQSKYKFVIVETSPRRRYRDLENGYYDIIFFENSVWGWNSREVSFLESKTFATGMDLYVAKRNPALKNQQDIFKDMNNKTYFLKSGFHYGFLDLKSHDVKKDNLFYTNSSLGNIKNIIRGKADITVVNDSFLKLFLSQSPQYKNEIVISKKADQVHLFKVLMSKGSPISIKEIEGLFPLIKKSGFLKSFLNFK